MRASAREEADEVLKEYEHYQTYKDPTIEGRGPEERRDMRHKLRKMALKDEIEHLTDEEKNFDERDDRRRAVQAELDKLVRAGKDRSEKARDLRRLQRSLADGSDESSYDSAASRVEFWRDMNVSDKAYKRAVICRRDAPQ